MRLRRYNENIEERKKLDMEIITLFIIDSDKFNTFVWNLYEDICFDSNEGDDYQDILEITGNVLSFLGEDEIEGIKTGEQTCISNIDILEILCSEGHIPPGNYQIN